MSSYKNIISLYNIIKAILKSQVLSLDLKEERELQDLSSNGSAFQTEGAAIVKDRPPVLRLNLDVESKIT